MKYTKKKRYNNKRYSKRKSPFRQKGGLQSTVKPTKELKRLTSWFSSSPGAPPPKSLVTTAKKGAKSGTGVLGAVTGINKPKPSIVTVPSAPKGVKGTVSTGAKRTRKAAPAPNKSATPTALTEQEKLAKQQRIENAQKERKAIKEQTRKQEEAVQRNMEELKAKVRRRNLLKTDKTRRKLTPVESEELETLEQEYKHNKLQWDTSGVARLNQDMNMKPSTVQHVTSPKSRKPARRGQAPLSPEQQAEKAKKEAEERAKKAVSKPPTPPPLPPHQASASSVKKGQGSLKEQIQGAKLKKGVKTQERKYLSSNNLAEGKTGLKPTTTEVKGQGKVGKVLTNEEAKRKAEAEARQKAKEAEIPGVAKPTPKPAKPTHGPAQSKKVVEPTTPAKPTPTKPQPNRAPPKTKEQLEKEVAEAKRLEEEARKNINRETRRTAETERMKKHRQKEAKRHREQEAKNRKITEHNKGVEKRNAEKMSEIDAEKERELKKIQAQQAEEKAKREAQKAEEIARKKAEKEAKEAEEIARKKGEKEAKEAEEKVRKAKEANEKEQQRIQDKIKAQHAHIEKQGKKIKKDMEAMQKQIANEKQAEVKAKLEKEMARLEKELATTVRPPENVITPGAPQKDLAGKLPFGKGKQAPYEGTPYTKGPTVQHQIPLDKNPNFSADRVASAQRKGKEAVQPASITRPAGDIKPDPKHLLTEEQLKKAAEKRLAEAKLATGKAGKTSVPKVGSVEDAMAKQEKPPTTMTTVSNPDNYAPKPGKGFEIPASTAPKTLRTGPRDALSEGSPLATPAKSPKKPSATNAVATAPKKPGAPNTVASKATKKKTPKHDDKGSKKKTTLDPNDPPAGSPNNVPGARDIKPSDVSPPKGKAPGLTKAQSEKPAPAAKPEVKKQKTEELGEYDTNELTQNGFLARPKITKKPQYKKGMSDEQIAEVEGARTEAQREMKEFEKAMMGDRSGFMQAMKEDRQRFTKNAKHLEKVRAKAKKAEKQYMNSQGMNSNYFTERSRRMPSRTGNEPIIDRVNKRRAKKDKYSSMFKNDDVTEVFDSSQMIH